ncbi:MAG: sugar ABC transporter permease [Candidatus Symbiobacter sp.]|nr:sugar ABC transporter permease [Candidatus Symbiobacter sp.]
MSDYERIISAEKPHRKIDFKHQFREYGMFMSLIVIMVFFQFTTNGTLFQPLNLTNIILQNSYIVIMALGMLLIIVAGHIDLSVGSVSGFIGAVAAVLMVKYGMNFLLVSFICIVLGAIIGALQGYWVAFFNIQSFIVTLAGMLVFKGLTLAVLQGESVGPFPPEFQLLSTGFIPDFFNLDWINAAKVQLSTNLPEFFKLDTLRVTSLGLGLAMAIIMVISNIRGRRERLAHGMDREPFVTFVILNVVFFSLIVSISFLLSQYRGLPNVLIVMLILMLFYDFITQRTTIGRRIYALGGNEKAARLSGVRTQRLTFYAFINMGVLAALAGLVFAARLNTATPKAGAGFELDVIAACFIGGASASGGVGKVMGAVIGAFIMGVMNNGMSIMGIGIDYQQVIKGLVLLAAVCVDVYNKN